MKVNLKVYINKYKPSWALLFFVLLLNFSLLSQQSNVGVTPSGFVENNGQIVNQKGETNENVRFLHATKKGLNIQLRENGFSYDTYKGINHSRKKSFLTHRIDIDFLETSEKLEVKARQVNESKINYVNSGKHIRATSYSEIIYKDVYPKIDAVFHFDENGKFKYDFIVKRGADINSIKLKAKGFNEVELIKDKIVFNLATGKLSEQIPISWFKETGEEVEVKFKIIEKNQDGIIFGFETSHENSRNNTLVIDPEPKLDWAYYLGDSLSSIGNKVITDVDGLIYTTGTTSSLDYIATNDVFQDTIVGSTDAYLLKAYTTGTILWATYFGGTDYETGDYIALDTAKNVFLTGVTNSVDLHVTDSLFQDTLNGIQDLYIAKFTEDGDYLWSTYYGTTGTEEDPKINCDFHGNFYILGTTDTDTISTPGAYQEYLAGEKDVFISKFSNNCQRLWSTYLGGTMDDIGTSIETSDSVFYITGYTQSDSLGTVGAHQEYKSDSTDGFIAQIDTSGQLQWFTYFGGEMDDVVSNIMVVEDVIGFTGFTASDSLIAFGLTIHQEERHGGYDAFIGRILPSGIIDWSSYFGGSEDDFGIDLTIEFDKNLIFAGNTKSPDSIATTDVHQEIYNNGFDMYIAKFSQNGEQIWGTYYGGPEDDICHSIDVYGNTSIYLTGFTYSDTNLVDTLTPYPHGVYSYNEDAILAKLNQKKSTACNGVSCSGGNGSGTESDPIQICRGEEIMLSTNGGATGSNAQWVWYENGCGSGATQVGTGDTIWITPEATSTYYVRAESMTDATGCSSIYIEVLETPTIDIFSNGVFCLGEDYVIQAYVTHDFYWTFPNDSIVEDMSLLIPSASYQDTGLFVMTAIAPSTGCTVYDSVYLTPSDSISYSLEIDSISCYGYSDGAINVLSDDTTYLFYWSSTGETTTSISDLDSGLHILTITDTNSCVISDTIILDGHDPFIIDTLVSPTGCEFDDGFIELVLDSLQAPYEIIWSHTNEDTAYLDGLGYGNYTATVIKDDGCMDSVSVVVLNKNGLDVNFLEVIPESCPNTNDGAVSVETQGGSGTTTLSWSHDEDLQDSNLTDLPPGFYLVTVTDSMGCFAKDSVQLDPAPMLNWTYTLNKPDCGFGNGAIIFSFEDTLLLESYEWQPTSYQSLSLFNIEAGNYNVTFIDTNACQYSDSIVLNAINNFAVEVTPDYAVIDAGENVELTASVQTGFTASSYNWSPNSFISCTNCQSTTVNPIATSEYIVQAFHEDGCYGQDTAKIVVERECMDIFVPDHFSPNNDGLNDEWCIIGSCIESSKVQVYDRWGRLIFSSDDPNTCWDGSHKGEIIQNGSYVVDINIKLLTGEEFKKRGSVKVVR